MKILIGMAIGIVIQIVYMLLADIVRFEYSARSKKCVRCKKPYNEDNRLSVTVNGVQYCKDCAIELFDKQIEMITQARQEILDGVYDDGKY